MKEVREGIAEGVANPLEEMASSSPSVAGELVDFLNSAWTPYHAVGMGPFIPSPSQPLTPSTSHSLAPSYFGEWMSYHAISTGPEPPSFPPPLTPSPPCPRPLSPTAPHPPGHGRPTMHLVWANAQSPGPLTP